MFVVGNSNGLMASSATHRGPQTTKPYYVTDKGDSDNVVINGDLTVEGNTRLKGTLQCDLSAVFITTARAQQGLISASLSTDDPAQNPIYIKNPNNIGNVVLADNALVVEGGNNRNVTAGDKEKGVFITTYKPFSEGVVDPGNAEDVGGIGFTGKDVSDNNVLYAAIRGECVNPTTAATRGRINFGVRAGAIERVMMQIDASRNIIQTQEGARFSDRNYTIFPSATKICEAGAITKQTSATIVTESIFTIPTNLDGYYSYTAQINLNTVADVSGPNDFMSVYLDLCGGILSPIPGTENIITITENANDAVRVVVSGIIMQRLVAGDSIRLLHAESADAGFTFASGTIQVAYNYLGDQLLA